MDEERPLEPRVEYNSERLAVVETRVVAVEGEVRRTRERLHDLESDRATLKLLVKQVSDMATNFERIAERAADRAVEKAFERKSEIGRRVKSLYVTYAIAGIALGGFLATILTELHRHWK